MSGRNQYGAQSQQDNESIYSLISRPEEVQARPAMYRSRYPPTAPPTASTFRQGPTSQAQISNIAGDYDDQEAHKRTGALFGPKESVQPDPSSYLKKGTRTLSLQKSAAKGMF